MSPLALIPRPEPGLWTVESLLQDLTVVTWAVAPERLRAHVPAGLELERCQGQALISAVTFYNTTFSLHWAPLGLSLGQTNYRVYVRHQGRRAVFFIGTTIDTAFVFIPRALWKMPWRRARYRFSPGSVEATGPWPMALSYTLEGPLQTLPGYRDLSEGMTVLTQPHVGYYEGTNGRMGEYTIWHDPYEAQVARVDQARFELLDALDIVPLASQGAVHSALYTARSLYHVHLPPRWLTDTSRG